MADKNFIGKVFEKVFSNGGSVIKLTLNDADKHKLQSPGDTTIEIKKSQKGNWYAEISSFQQAPQQPQRTYPQNNQVSIVDDDPNDLPF